MEARDAYIALNMIDHVGPVRVKRLMERFGQPQAILAASARELMQVDGVGEEVARAITGWQSQVDLDRELKRIADFGARVLTLDDSDYPANLRQIYDPPLALYVKGTLEPRDKHAIAIVGSRQTTYYGLETARKLGYQLAFTGVTVVSGLARGIDTAAHQGALAANGRTLAVLGTGLDVVYPPENGALYEKIAAGGGAVMTQFPFGVRPDPKHFPLRNRIVSGLARGIDTAAHTGAMQAKGRTVAVIGSGLDKLYPPENRKLADQIVAKGGAVVSEFPFGVMPDRQHFPMRNRIISGWSIGVLVVEAGAQSGALISARFAGEQGRQVFAVPGRADSPQSKGCHRLIKSGAKLVEDAEDVLAEFEDLFPKSARPAAPETAPDAVELSDVEQKVLAAIGDEETDLDAVIRQSGLTSAEVFATLLRLEMRRLIRQLPGKRLVRIQT